MQACTGIQLKPNVTSSNQHMWNVCTNQTLLTCLPPHFQHFLTLWCQVLGVKNDCSRDFRQSVMSALKATDRQAHKKTIYFSRWQRFSPLCACLKFSGLVEHYVLNTSDEVMKYPQYWIQWINGQNILNTQGAISGQEIVFGVLYSFIPTLCSISSRTVTSLERQRFTFNKGGEGRQF